MPSVYNGGTVLRDYSIQCKALEAAHVRAQRNLQHVCLACERMACAGIVPVSDHYLARAGVTPNLA